MYITCWAQIDAYLVLSRFLNPLVLYLKSLVVLNSFSENRVNWTILGCLICMTFGTKASYGIGSFKTSPHCQKPQYQASKPEGWLQYFFFCRVHHSLYFKIEPKQPPFFHVRKFSTNFYSENNNNCIFASLLCHSEASVWWLSILSWSSKQV